MAWELSITLEDRPGTLAGLSEVLGRAGVNIETVAAFVAGGQFGVRVLVDDAEVARKALEGEGMTVDAIKDPLVVSLDHAPGALGVLARRVANAGINIESSYVLGDENGKKRLVLTVDDPERARSLL
jgi:hypothetical protein